MLTRAFTILIIIMLQIFINPIRSLPVRAQTEYTDKTELEKQVEDHQIVFRGIIESAEKNASGRCKIEIRIEETLKGNFYNHYRLKPTSEEGDYKYCQKDYKSEVIVIDRPNNPENTQDSVIYPFDQKSWELIKVTRTEEKEPEEIPWFLSSDFLAIIVILCLLGVISYYIRTSNTVISYNQTKFKTERNNQNKDNISKKKQ